MKKLFLTFYLFAVASIVYSLSAQNYLITFNGIGVSTSISTIEVENMSSGTILTLNGSDILHLTGTAGISQNADYNPSAMRIYPNPMLENATIGITPPFEGDAIITIFELTGKVVYQVHCFLENTSQKFNIAGIRNGLYLINITGNSYQFSAKLLCNGAGNGAIRIEKFIKSDEQTLEKKSKKENYETLTTIEMPYTNGDRLKFTGISSNFSTIITDVPSQDKTLTFNFIPCIDGENNNYPIVEIGTQVWMAKNLRATKYRDSTVIPLITDNDIWAGLESPGYCWYNNDETNSKIPYGAIYNWMAVNTGKLCPTDWHVPSQDDWELLVGFLGGEELAGGKLKEPGTAHWESPNVGATNESGFTALSGPFRSYDGLYFFNTGSAYWWSSTKQDSIYAWLRELYSNDESFYSSNHSKLFGFQVRCLKDTQPTFTLPTLSTQIVTGVTSNSAMSGGNISSDGGDSITARGVCWSTSANPTITDSITNDGNGVGEFTSLISGLSPDITYYVRAYATNSVGTAYGNEIIFTPGIIGPPTSITGSATAVSSNSATLNGIANANNSSSIVSFEYGISTSYDSIITAIQSPVNGFVSVNVSTNLTGLIPGKTYHYRIKAVNSAMTTYGIDSIFTTPGTILDADGNVYNVLQIGSQVWMKENLKTTKYNDSTAISLVEVDTVWSNLSTSAYCWFNNDQATYINTYGLLYNWYTVNSAKLCPLGWHVPTDAEWTALTDYLGGLSVSGGKLKETGTTHWTSPNTGATNETGFTALPGGLRGNYGRFTNVGFIGLWWSSTEANADRAWGWYINFETIDVIRSFYKKQYGYSVRCLKD